MSVANGFPPIVAIFYAEFHPTEGPKVCSQVPAGSIVPPFDNNDSSALDEPLFDFNCAKSYVIPKPQLCNRLVSCLIGKYVIIGYPVHISGSEYPRNFFAFNLVFVFDRDSDTSVFEMSIRRLARMFMALEEQSKFLFKATSTNFIDNIIAQIYQDLNNYSECLIPIDESNSVNMKLFPIFPSPPPLQSYLVPISTVNLAGLIDENWDPTMEKIIPFINGINSIRRIADLADADYELTLECIQHLVHYKCIVIVDIFQFSNIYAPTSDISMLLTDPDMYLECQAYVFVPPPKSKKPYQSFNSGSGSSHSHLRSGISMSMKPRSASSGSNNGAGGPGNSGTGPISIKTAALQWQTANAAAAAGVSVGSSPSSFSTSKSANALYKLLPSMSDLFQLYSSLSQGQTVRQWVMENKKQLRYIDVRRFISFGVIKGLIYRVHSYPILESTRGRRMTRRSMNGLGFGYGKAEYHHSFGNDVEADIERLVMDIIRQPKHFDEICTELHLAKKEVEELLKSRGDWTIVSA